MIIVVITIVHLFFTLIFMIDPLSDQNPAILSFILLCDQQKLVRTRLE